MKIKNIEYYFLGLLVLVIIGFWPSYFSRFFDGTADFTHYFHFHATTATLWLLMLIAQPILIRKRQFVLHKRIGKLSFLLVPLVFISVMLLAHHRADPGSQNLTFDLWVPFKDLIIFSFGFVVAIRYRRKMKIHARGMVFAGMAMIEPTMVRIVFNVFGASPDAGYLIALSPIYLILIALVIMERREPQVRWVFQVGLLLFTFIHSVLIFKIEISPWAAFAKWYTNLPLT